MAETVSSETLNDLSNYQILASEEQVLDRIDQMAGEVIERYSDKNPLFVCLLRGGAPFSSQLMFALARRDHLFHPELDYMTISTYTKENQAKESKVVMDIAPNTVVEGRTVVLIDDVIDQGLTATFTSGHLMNKGAAEVDLMVLVRKQTDRSLYGEPVIYGFDAPDKWLVGMGMDDGRLGSDGHRWLGFLAVAP